MLKSNNLNFSGVYVLKSINSNVYYVGSSKVIGRRIVEHLRLLKKGKHHCEYLQNYVNKHGVDSIKLFCIEESESVDLFKIEQTYLDYYNTNYVLFNSLKKAYFNNSEKLKLTLLEKLKNNCHHLQKNTSEKYLEVHCMKELVNNKRAIAKVCNVTYGFVLDSSNTTTSIFTKKEIEDYRGSNQIQLENQKLQCLEIIKNIKIGKSNKLKIQILNRDLDYIDIANDYNVVYTFLKSPEYFNYDNSFLNYFRSIYAFNKYYRVNKNKQIKYLKSISLLKTKHTFTENQLLIIEDFKYRLKDLKYVIKDKDESYILKSEEATISFNNKKITRQDFINVLEYKNLTDLGISYEELNRLGYNKAKRKNIRNTITYKFIIDNNITDII